jgi:hypothetical protein
MYIYMCVCVSVGENGSMNEGECRCEEKEWRPWHHSQTTNKII